MKIHILILKNSKYIKEFNIHKYFDEYCDFLNENNLYSNNFIQDNGGVLALYGIRDSHDLDFVTTENIICNEKNVDCMNGLHKHKFNNLGFTIEDLIKNAENHFHYYNKKVLSISILKKFKYNRIMNGVSSKIRPKDIRDYKMICDNFIVV